MSAASKATFAASCLFAVGSFIYINVEQRIERENLRQGPIKDAERMRQKMSKKQAANELEHREQLALKEQYEKVQPLSAEVITGEDHWELFSSATLGILRWKKMYIARDRSSEYRDKRK